MKKIALFLTVFSISTLLYCQESLTKKQERVQHAVVKLFDALSNRDSISLKAYSTTDITLYEYGQIWNMDTLILKAITLNQSADFKRTNSFEFINTMVDKTTASVTNRLQSVIVKDGKQVTSQWMETVVLIREKKEWRVKHLHSTLIKRS